MFIQITRVDMFHAYYYTSIQISRLEEIDLKNRTYYFSDDIINIKNLDPDNTNINKKLYKNIFTYYVGYVTPSSVKHLCFIINNTNGYIEQSNENTYLTLIPTNENKDALKNYEEIWIKIKDFIRSANRSSNGYDENYLKNIVNSGDDLTVKKSIKIS